MDVPTPINYQNIKINNISKENENLIDLNGILVQFPYIDSLKEKEKKEYDQKNNACCCCGNGANNYICQIFVLYIILFFFIICSIIFRISTIQMYNNLRNQDLANFKLYSTAYTTSSINNIINNNNNFKPNYTYPYYENCTLSNYENGRCTRLQYELENGCNFHNYYVRNKCDLYDYRNYCNNNKYRAGYCYYYDYQVYQSNHFYCYSSDYNEGKCSYEQYNKKPSNRDFIYYYRRLSFIGYIIDYSGVKFFCDYQNFENNVLIFGIISMCFILIFIITYLKSIKKKIKVEKENEIYYYIILSILFLLYIIFSLISILFCYLLVYSLFLILPDLPEFFIFDVKESTNNDKHYEYINQINYIEEYLFDDNWWVFSLSITFNTIICILSFFFLIPIKKLILSHLNLEDRNEETIKYKKTSLYIKEKKLDIEIKLVDDLVFKLDNEDKIYTFKEVKIPEIKKNDNIYIYINNFYIKEQLSTTNLYYYNMNIQIERLYELINLMIVIIIILIGLSNIFTMDKYFLEYYDSSDYSDSYFSKFFSPNLYLMCHLASYKVYGYFEYYFELFELIFSFIILFVYLFSFIKRLLNGGIKTKSGIKRYQLMIKIFIISNYIFMFLSFVLFNYAMFLSIFYNLTDFKFTILIFHSSFNFTILILYIPISYFIISVFGIFEELFSETKLKLKLL